MFYHGFFKKNFFELLGQDMVHIFEFPCLETSPAMYSINKMITECCLTPIYDSGPTNHCPPTAPRETKAGVLSTSDCPLRARHPSFWGRSLLRRSGENLTVARNEIQKGEDIPRTLNQKAPGSACVFKRLRLHKINAKGRTKKKAGHQTSRKSVSTSNKRSLSLLGSYLVNRSIQFCNLGSTISNLR